MLTSRFWKAISKRIPGVTFRAETDGHVINHETLGTDTTRARARVSAFLSQAGLIIVALRINGTFWPTIRRTTNVIFHTRARWHARVAAIATSGKWTTGGWNARIFCRLRGIFVYNCKRIIFFNIIQNVYVTYLKTYAFLIQIKFYTTRICNDILNKHLSAYLRVWKHVTKGSPVKP